MNKFGLTALQAVKLIHTGQVQDPVEAWKRAARSVFPYSLASQQKGCPKDAFLGLCERGLVDGIPPGTYTNSVKNKEYACLAVAALRENPALSQSPDELWKVIMAGDPKSHNSQMDVVVALWKGGYMTGLRSIKRL
jgi:hypothetical protein